MTVKYLHIRQCDEDKVVLPHGGLTIAYTVDRVTGHIVVTWTKCRFDELFCYRTGRETALARLQSPEGDVEVIQLEHPMSLTLIDWIATVVWPDGPDGWGMGHAIDIEQDDKGRWVSTFEPSAYNCKFLPDEDPTEPDYCG